MISRVCFFFLVVSRAVFEVGASGLLIVILGCFLSRFLFLKITQLQRERLKPPGLSPAEDEELVGREDHRTFMSSPNRLP